jgi:hypothetical protein
VFRRGEKHSKPAYPTQADAREDGAFLARHRPAPWKRLAIVTAAAGALAGGAALLETATALPEPSGATSQPTTRLAPSTARALAHVAPVFEHGEGIATTGCQAIVAPIFISEEEAYLVIRDELAKAGVELSATHVEAPGMRVAVWESEEIVQNRADHLAILADPKASPEQKETSKQAVEAMRMPPPAPLINDLVDARKHIAVEFVSRESYNRWAHSFSMRETWSYEFKHVAEHLTGELRQAEAGYFGVFYDPSSRIDRQTWDEINKLGPNVDHAPAIQRAKDDARAGAKENLRQQVADFAAWLKKEGAI